MRPFVLLADDATFASLREMPLLRRLLRDGEDAAPWAADEEADGAAALVRYDPARLLRAPADVGGGSETTDAADATADDRFARLLAGTLCHVVRLSADVPAPLGSLADWYARFRHEAVDRVDFRGPEYRHVLVVVAEQPVPAAGLDRLRALLDAPPAEAVLGDVYVMLHRLNLGEASAAPAREVWADAVSRLLVHLWLEGPTPAAAARSRTVAWRGTELVPSFEASSEREAVEPALAQGHRAFHAVDDGLAAAAEAHVRAAPVVAPGPCPVTIPKFDVREPWQELDAAHEHRQSDDRAHWHDEHRKSGADLDQARARRAAEEESSALARRRWAWGAAHEGPGAVHAIADRIGLPSAVAAALPAREVAAGRVRLDAARERLRSAVADAEGCAGHYDAARFGFVGLGLRAWLAAAGAVAVAWGVGWVHHAFIGRLGASLLVAASVALVPFLAALVFWEVERRAGRRARAALAKVYAEEVRLARQELQDAFRALVGAGTAYHLAGRRAARFLRLRTLLVRLQAILRRRWRVETGLRDAADGGDAPAGAALDDERRRRRAAFLAHSRVELRGLVLDAGDGEATAAVVRKAGRLRDRWRQLADDLDRAVAGHFPLVETGDWLRRRYDELVEDATLAVLSRVFARTPEERRLELFRLLRERRAGERFAYYLSVRAADEHVDRDLARSTLHVRPGFVGPAQASKVDASVVERSALDRTPLVGLLVDEVPVTLTAGPDGRLAVASRIAGAHEA